MPEQDQQAEPTCWWHPDRQTGLRCTRCERSACPDCLREASVGFQCIDCVAAGRRQHRVRQASYRKSGFGYRTVAGARASARPIVTPVLIALNVLAYLVTVAQSQSVMGNANSGLFQQGVLLPPAIAIGDLWRLFTSGFLHYGPLHLAVNMLALWFLGRDLELLLGKVRYLAVYLLALLGGGVAVYALEDINSFTAGASGAVYGMLGGVLVAAVRLKLNLAPIIGIILINLVISVSIPQISLLGHLGGLIAGAVLTVAMVYAPERRRTVVQTAAGMVAAILLLVVVAARTSSLAPGLVEVEDPVHGEVVCSQQQAQCWVRDS
ncbi:MAG: rhomboid family intramembrane serine protease [Haloechinothrix sp.]